MSQGTARGSIELTWTQPEFDGFSSITDYEYKLEWEYNGSYVSWNDDEWTSVGSRSMTTMRKLITGLHSRTQFRATIRARNIKGPSRHLPYKTITTR